MNRRSYTSSGVEATVSLLMLAIALVGAYAWGALSCHFKSERMGLGSDYGPIQGCMVMTKSGWRPIEMLRELEP